MTCSYFVSPGLALVVSNRSAFLLCAYFTDFFGCCRLEGHDHCRFFRAPRLRAFVYIELWRFRFLLVQ